MHRAKRQTKAAAARKQTNAKGAQTTKVTEEAEEAAAIPRQKETASFITQTGHVFILTPGQEGTCVELKTGSPQGGIQVTVISPAFKHNQMRRMEFSVANRYLLRSVAHWLLMADQVAEADGLFAGPRLNS